jgi:hypothetical protein
MDEEIIQNFDLLMNMDLLEQQENWHVIEDLDLAESSEKGFKSETEEGASDETP